MSTLTSKTYRVPRQVDEIPDSKSGIYSFCLRFPSDMEFGVSKSAIHDNAVNNIVKKLEDFEFLMNSIEMNGTVYDQKFSQYIRKDLEIIARSKHEVESTQIREVFIKLAADQKPESLREVLRAIRASFNLAPPIYIGMTDKQSLRKRLLQHLSGGSQFSQRLYEAGFSWNDVLYRCCPVDRLYLDSSLEIEKLVQTIFKPKLSLR